MPETEKKSSKHLLGKIPTRTGVIILGIVVLLVAVRIALPYVVKSVINQKLNSLADYRGHVDDVDLHIIRGAYSIRGINVLRDSESVFVPFFSAEAAGFSVDWGALIHGALVARATIVHPRVYYSAEKPSTEAKKAVDSTRNWQRTLKSLLPLRIDSFTISNGEIHFCTATTDPPLHIAVQDLNVEATNLTNSRKVSESLVSHITANANVMGDGKFQANLKINPLAAKPTFNLAMQITKISIPKFNDILRQKAKFDIEQGFFSLYLQCIASEGKFNGYLKPLVEDLKVVNWKEDKKKPAKLAWEGIIGAVTGLFKNKPTDRLATRIPISGTFDNPNPDIWATIGNALKNAFIQAILPGLDREFQYQAGR